MSSGEWGWPLRAVRTSPGKSWLDEPKEPTVLPLADNSVTTRVADWAEKGATNMKYAVRWHALIPRPIMGPEEALAFVNACGFCTWGPVPRLSFPNLAEAMGETATSVLDRTWRVER